MADNIRVSVRVRPLISREIGCSKSWRIEGDAISQIENGKPVGTQYGFDKVFGSAHTNLDVYREVALPIMQEGMQGFNGTVFAYGQTSSGKTHTMMGNAKMAGIIPLAMTEIFKIIEETSNREFLLRVAYMEIYNEQISDLLSNEKSTRFLKIHENSDKQVYVNGLTEAIVTSEQEIFNLMKTGEAKRHVGETNMNERSSRSHTIFRMIIESRERLEDDRRSIDGDGAVWVSHLNLVDLAGSERASQTGATGDRLKEGCAINKSLFQLGHVISQLSEGDSKFVNFRDSKLTRILQNSLGGNSKTAIICTVTPAAVEETHSTLKFASSAKNIRNKATINEVLSDEAMLKRYRKELHELKRKIEEVGIHKLEEEKGDLEKRLFAKDMLQQEQEDKIKKLTQMLCVSHSIATVPKPDTFKARKLRRETWCPGLAASRSIPRGPAVSDDMLSVPSSSLFKPFSKNKRHTDEFHENAEDILSTLVEEDEDVYSPASPMKKRRVAFLTPPLETSVSHDTHVSIEGCQTDPEPDPVDCPDVDLEEKDRIIEELHRELREKEDLLEQNNQTVVDFLTEHQDCSAVKMEVDHCRYEISTLKEELEKKTTDNDELSLRVQSLQEELTCKTTTPTESEECHNSCNKEIKKLKDDLDNKENELALLNSFAEESTKEMMAQLTTSQSKIAELQELLANTEDNGLPIDSWNDKASELEEKLNEAQMFYDNSMCDKKDLQSKLVKAEQAMCAMQEELHEWKVKFSQLEEDYQQKECDFIELEEFTRLEADLKSPSPKDGQTDEIAQLKHRIKQLESLMESSELHSQELEENYQGDVTKLQQEIASKQEEIDLLKDKQLLQEKDDSLLSLCDKNDDSELRREIQSLRKSESDAESVVMDTNKKLSQAHDKINELTQQLTELKSRYSKLEADKADFDCHLEIEKENHERLCTELKQQIQQANEEIEQLRSNIKEVPESESKQEEEGSLQREADTLNGRLVDTLNGQLADLQMEIVRLTQDKAAIQEDLQTSINEATASNQDLLELKEQLKTLESNVSDKDLVVAELQQKIATYEEQLVEMADLKNRLELKETMEEGDSDLEALVEDLTLKLTDAEEKIAQLEESVQDYKHTNDVSLEDKNSYNTKVLELQDKVVAANAEIESLHKMKAVETKGSETPDYIMQQQLYKEQAANQELAEKYEKLHHETSQHKEKILSETNRDLDQQKRLEEMEKARRESFAVFSQSQKENETIIENLNKKIYNLQSQLQKVTGEHEMAKQQLNKVNEQSEHLRTEIRDLERLHDQHNQSVIGNRKEMDQDKLQTRIKQLQFNLDLTKQKSDKFECQVKSLGDSLKKTENIEMKCQELQIVNRGQERLLLQEKEQYNQLLCKFNSSSSELGHMKVHTDMQKAEIQHLSRNIVELKEKTSQLESHRTEITAQLESTKKQYNELKDNSNIVESKQQDKYDELEKTVEDLTSELVLKSEALVALESSDNDCKGKIVDLELKIDNLSSQNIKLQDRISSLQSECTDNITSFEERENDYHHKIELLQKEIEEISLKRKCLQDAFSAGSLTKEENQQKINILENEIQRISTEKSTVEETLSLLQEGENEKQKKIGSLESEIERISTEKSAAQDRLSLLEKSENEMQHKMESLDSQISTLLSEKLLLQDTLETMEIKAADNQQRIQSIKGDLQNSLSANEQLHQDNLVSLESKEKEYFKKIETLDKELQTLKLDIITKTETIQELTDKLCNGESGYETVRQQLEELKSKEECQLQELQRKELQIQSLSCDVEQYESKLDEMRQSLEEATTDTKQQVTNAQEEVLKIKKEKASLQKELESIREEKTQIESRIGMLEVEVEEVQTEANDKYVDLFERMTTEKEDAVNATAEGIRAEENIKQLDLCQQLSDIGLELEEYKAKVISLEEATPKVQIKKENAVELEETIASLKDQLEQEMNKFALMKSKGTEMLEKLEGRIQELNSERSQSKERIETLESEVNQSKKKMIGYERQLEKSKQQVEKKNEEVAKRMKDLQDILESSHHEKQIKHLETCCEEADEELRQEKIQHEKVLQELNDLKKRQQDDDQSQYQKIKDLEGELEATNQELVKTRLHENALEVKLIREEEPWKKKVESLEWEAYYQKERMQKLKDQIRILQESSSEPTLKCGRQSTSSSVDRVVPVETSYGRTIYQLEAEIMDLKDKNNKLNTELSEANKAIQDLKNHKQTCKDKNNVDSHREALQSITNSPMKTRARSKKLVSGPAKDEEVAGCPTQ